MEVVLQSRCRKVHKIFSNDQWSSLIGVFNSILTEHQGRRLYEAARCADIYYLSPVSVEM